MVIVVTSWLIRWRRRLNFKALISRSIEQETIQNPRAPDNAATLDLHVRTTQARGHLEHEYQPLRHRKNDFPKYENVKYFFNKQEQKDDVYEEIDLVRIVNLLLNFSPS